MHIADWLPTLYSAAGMTKIPFKNMNRVSLSFEFLKRIRDFTFLPNFQRKAKKILSFLISTIKIKISGSNLIYLKIRFRSKESWEHRRNGFVANPHYGEK